MQSEKKDILEAYDKSMEGWRVTSREDLVARGRNILSTALDELEAEVLDQFSIAWDVKPDGGEFAIMLNARQSDGTIKSIEITKGANGGNVRISDLIN